MKNKLAQGTTLGLPKLAPPNRDKFEGTFEGYKEYVKAYEFYVSTVTRLREAAIAAKELVHKAAAVAGPRQPKISPTTPKYRAPVDSAPRALVRKAVGEQNWPKARSMVASVSTWQKFGLPDPKPLLPANSKAERIRGKNRRKRAAKTLRNLRDKAEVTLWRKRIEINSQATSAKEVVSHAERPRGRKPPGVPTGSKPSKPVFPPAPERGGSPPAAYTTRSPSGTVRIEQLPARGISAYEKDEVNSAQLT